MSGSRLFWIDFVKTIGIWLVVWGHFLPNCCLKQFIYSFHVPMFFIVSGYLSDYLHRGERKFRFRSLLVPYTVWTGISVITYMAIGRTADVMFGWKYVLESFLPIDGFMNWNVPLWFLYALFFVEASAPGIDEIKGVVHGRWNCVWRFSLFCIVVIALASIDKVFGLNIFAYRQICLGIAFYIAGAALHRFRVMNFLEGKWLYVFLIALTGCVAAYINGKTSIWNWTVGRLYLLLVSGLLLTTAVMFVAYSKEKRLADWRLLRIFSNRQAIMTILCTHFAFFYGYGRLGASHGITMTTLTSAGVIMAYYLVFHLKGTIKLNRKDDTNSCIS